MRSLRSRPADPRTPAVARARVARLAGSARVVPPAGGDGTSGERGWWSDADGPGGAGGLGDADGWDEAEALAVADAPTGHGGRHRRTDGPPGAPAGGVLGRTGGEGLDDGPARDADKAGRDADGAGRYAADGARGSEGDWPAAVHDHLPLALRVRLRLERGHVTVVVLVVLLGVLGAAVVYLVSRPQVVPIDAEITATGTPAHADDDARPEPPAADEAEPGGAGDGSGTGSGAGAAPAGTIMIHVAGLVAAPGVVELPAGTRVVDAIEAAGGPTAEADLTPLNLARVLTDGEQVIVTAEPPAGQPAVPPPPDPGAGVPVGPPAGPVNLNTATAADLDTLPGIGPTLAGRILEWREQHGRFTTVDELREVSGIGEQRFAELEPLVAV
ncbi:ComEA family DNA-binding protein [Jiangella gansuensis]|uniref:ComEA family DNA-binding protein n=1 Tax=Jiangella gansuensis TaxID=281473 RepID=UPI0004B7EA8D|nr:ComEA family DNA-binding protein [Jiangella gansuensis]